MGWNDTIAKTGSEVVTDQASPAVDFFPAIINGFRKRCAWMVDDFCFSLINYVHRRHPLPENYAEVLGNYTRKWAQATEEEYYSVDPAARATALDRLDQHGGKAGRAGFVSPLRLGLPRNDEAVLDFFPCREGWTAPTMFLAHGLMSVSDAGYRRWAGILNQRGWNAIFPHLPFHYDRCPPGHFSGELAVGADIIRAAEGVRQSVQELRIVMDWLQSRGCPLIGAWGTSYGGWISGILGCVDSRLQRMLLLEPVLNLQHAIWKSHGTGSMRADLQRRGVNADSVESHMRLCSPSFMKLQMSAHHVILVGGEYDRITPPEELQRLQIAWPGSHLEVVQQGHVGYHLMPKSLSMAEELWPEDFRAGAR